MKAVVTGAAGFTGFALTEVLRQNDIEVYAFVREGSSHNVRLNSSDAMLHTVEFKLGQAEKVAEQINDECDFFFHLAWEGGKNFDAQLSNVDYTLDALKAAKKLKCKRFIATGSQAEYGVVPQDEKQSEDRVVAPVTAYGAAKAASCFLSKELAKELEVEWIWGRIFSLIGKNEPAGRMLPDLYKSLKSGKDFFLSSCTQNWDYLDVYDAAEALLALALKGHDGEIYNIAKGDYKPLKEYTEDLSRLIAGNARPEYGLDANPYISLQPSVEKIIRDTGWRPKRLFSESITDYDR